MAKSAVEALLEGAGAAPVQETVAAPDLPALPKTKGEVGKLSAEQMDALVEAHGFTVPGEWAEGTAKERHAILNVILGYTKPKKGSTVQVQVTNAAPATGQEVVNADDADPTAPPPATQAQFEAKALLQAAADDPLILAAQEIENLPTQDAIEAALATRLTSTGMDRFYLGGLLIRLLSVGTFPDNTHFKDYIEKRWGLKYRSARNYITLYSDLLKANIPWDTVNTLGWSKVQILLPVLTPENAAEWVEKAKQYNNETLEAAVKQLQATTTDGATQATQSDTLEASKMKTLTFPAAPDQEEIIMEAVADAMKKAGTEHKGVALELICTEYLGSTTPGIKAKPVAAEPDALATFKHYRAKHANTADALNALFAAFDDVFPNVSVSMKVTQE